MFSIHNRVARRLRTCATWFPRELFMTEPRFRDHLNPTQLALCPLWTQNISWYVIPTDLRVVLRAPQQNNLLGIRDTLKSLQYEIEVQIEMLGELCSSESASVHSQRPAIDLQLLPPEVSGLPKVFMMCDSSV